MIGINTRKVLFSLIAIAVIYFIAVAALAALIASGSLGAAVYGSIWFSVVYAIVLNALGIIIGLIWEKATRPRYLRKIESSPAPSDRVKRIYNVILIIAIVVGAFYVLSNAWGAYELLSLNIIFTIPPLTYAGFYISLVRYIVLALVFLWLYSEPAPKSTSPVLNIRSGLLVGVIYFFIMAVFSIFSLANFKVTAGTASMQVSGSGASSQAAVNGQAN